MRSIPRCKCLLEALPHLLPTLRQLFALRVSIEAPAAYHHSVARRHMQPPAPEELLEVHLFDFDRHLYGQTIETFLVAYLRPEAKFDSAEELKAQMERDAEGARNALG